MSLTLHLQATDLIEHGGTQLALLVTGNRGARRRRVLNYNVGRREASQRLSIPHGESCTWLKFPAVSAPTTLRAEIDGRTTRTTVRPARSWTVCIVNHTHTDLGYVDYPPNVDRDFFRFLREALALVDETRAFPEAARYRWTIETAYHVRNFLRYASRRDLRRLVGCLRRGVLDVSACYLNMTDLPSTDQVLRSFNFIRDFARRHRIPLEVAMVCDINGLPWIYPAALHDLGVRNLSMSINTDMAREPLVRPRPLWWESPEGKRVLVWNGEVYCLGNRLKIDRGASEAMRAVAEHLDALHKQSYPYDRVLVVMCGLKLDCAPPTIAPSLTVRDWNERFANPQLRMATLTQWFRRLRPLLGDEVPTYRGHWPDYWAFGLGSGADEIRYARETQHLLTAASTAAAYARLTDHAWSLPSEALEQAYEAAALATEHTWGAACSVEAPYSDAARLQWQHCRNHFYRARLEVLQPWQAALERIGRAARPDGPGVVVHNSLAWERGGIAELELVNYPLPGYSLDQLRDPRTGRTVPCWRERYEGTLQTISFPVGRAPATGYVVLPVLPERTPKMLAWVPAGDRTDVIENRYYRVRIDQRTGGLRSLYDKQLRRELVRKDRELPFGRVIVERLPGPKARSWGNHARRQELFRRGFKRTGAQAGTFARRVLPGFFQTLSFGGRCPGLDGVRTTIRLHQRTKRIDFEWRLCLPENPDPQAGYVAFPFAGADPRVRLEVPGAVFEPGAEQVPTTCHDFYTVQNFARIETRAAAITLVPRDTPLIQLNEITTFQFREALPPFNGTVVAWLHNNYWGTNFPASQPGEHAFRFSLTSGSRRAHNLARTCRFAYEVANPLRARFLPQAHAHRHEPLPQRPSCGSFVKVTPANVLLVSVATDDSGALLFRLQEFMDRTTNAELHFAELKPRRAARTDLFGGAAQPLPVRGHTVRCEVPARALTTVRIEF